MKTEEGALELSILIFTEAKHKVLDSEPYKFPELKNSAVEGLSREGLISPDLKRLLHKRHDCLCVHITGINARSAQRSQIFTVKKTYLVKQWDLHITH